MVGLTEQLKPLIRNDMSNYFLTSAIFAGIFGGLSHYETGGTSAICLGFSIVFVIYSIFFTFQDNK